MNGHALAAAPDTFKPPVFAKPGVSMKIPNAPPELLEVVQREQAFSKFCYQEFGEKADPSLQGGVAMVVTVNMAKAASDARVKEPTALDYPSGQAGQRIMSEREGARACSGRFRRMR